MYQSPQMDTVSVPQAWINSVLGVVAAIVLWIVKRTVAKVDKICETYVSRDEITTMLSGMSAERRSNHAQNLEQLNHLRVDIRAVHARIDARNDRSDNR